MKGNHMPHQTSFEVKVLLLQEGDYWVAQGLEHDIAAQGKTIAAAKMAFERTFVGQIVVDVRSDKQPLEGIERAPQHYWDKFEHAERLAEQRPFQMPAGFPYVNAPTADLRIAA